MITAILVTLLITTVCLLFRQIAFTIESGLCWIVGFLSDVFDKVAGLDTVTYNKKSTLLIDVFFGNSTIKVIYWGMALIGIIMCFGFAIVAIIRKASDSDDKVKTSIGGILKNMFTSITIILLMNFIVTATVEVTSVLLTQINYLFENAQSFDFEWDVTYDEYDYAAMARSMNTIGNYRLNSSYNSRYNINSCYNDIREDLNYLAKKGVFDVTYQSTEYDSDGNVVKINSWQSVLEKIYRASPDMSKDMNLDEYDSKLSKAILEAMDIIQKDSSLKALDKYHVLVKGQEIGTTPRIDRIIMLIGSMYGNLSEGDGLTDYLRAPYYYGQKDIFDFDTVNDDFDLSFGAWNHITVIVVAIFFIKELLGLCFNAVARIFNMLLLYLAAPPFIAVMPLDDGGKFKQWRTSFIIQSCGLFGSVISLRLVMIFIPVIFDGSIRFFSNAKMDFFCRIIILAGALLTSRKASGMITGILADSAGHQAIMAGDVAQEGRSAVSTGLGLAKAAGGFVGGLALKGTGALDNKLKASSERRSMNPSLPSSQKSSFSSSGGSSSASSAGGFSSGSTSSSGSPSIPFAPSGGGALPSSNKGIEGGASERPRSNSYSASSNGGFDLGEGDSLPPQSHDTNDLPDREYSGSHEEDFAEPQPDNDAPHHNPFDDLGPSVSGHPQQPSESTASQPLQPLASRVSRSDIVEPKASRPASIPDSKSLKDLEFK